MTDTSRLLNQLRIERENPQLDTAPPSSRRGLWVGIVGVAVIAGSVVAYSLLRSTPVTASNAEAANAEVIKPAAATVDAASDSAVLNASGYIVARRQATVASKLTARVVDVLIDEGQAVKEGEVIAVLDDTNVRAAYSLSKAQVEQAKASQRAAETQVANETPLFKRMEVQRQKGFSSQQDYDNAKARLETARSNLEVSARSLDVAEASLAIAARNLEDTKVRAPFTGIITVKAAQPGEMVSPNSAGGGYTRTGIGTIVDMASLEVDVDVSENFINRISAGQQVTVKLNAYPDWSIPAHVITVVPTADRAKATVKVRIGLDEHDPRILPDMGVRVAFLRSKN